MARCEVCSELFDLCICEEDEYPDDLGDDLDLSDGETFEDINDENI